MIKPLDIRGALLIIGADNGNRTRISTLGRLRSTTELYLHVPIILLIVV